MKKLSKTLFLTLMGLMATYTVTAKTIDSPPYYTGVINPGSTHTQIGKTNAHAVGFNHQLSKNINVGGSVGGGKTERGETVKSAGIHAAVDVTNRVSVALGFGVNRTAGQTTPGVSLGFYFNKEPVQPMARPMAKIIGDVTQQPPPAPKPEGVHSEQNKNIVKDQ